MVCSNQRKVSSLTLLHTEQKVDVELKPRGRMFGRLGTAKMKHEWGVEVSDIVHVSTQNQCKRWNDVLPEKILSCQEKGRREGSTCSIQGAPLLR